ncbi:MAG: hypothetical protein HYU39_06930 [Thaumarchaeota archaeon]|nr:hypothetical protein [Nitrososphaerota archaeon]
MLEVAQASFGVTTSVTVGYIAVTLWLIGLLRGIAYGKRREVFDRYMARIKMLTVFLAASMLLLLSFLVLSVTLPSSDTLLLFFVNSILTPLGVIWTTALIRRARKRLSVSSL